MKKFMKATAAIMLTMAMLFVSGCKPDDEPNNNNDNGGGGTTLPVVTTSAVSEITETNAIGGGEVTSNGGSAIKECGVCWSAETNPTIEGDHAVSSSNAGSYLCLITSLIPNTTYYVRAYAINDKGVGYGNQVSFITHSGNGGGPDAIPVVETSPVKEITETSAIGSGVVTSDGGGSIVERGVCWSTQNNPIVSGNHAIAGTGAGSFSCEIVDLVPNTTYYVRAYAINSMGVGYGNEVNFTTLTGSGGGVDTPEGAIGGIYSVSAMDKVYFSQGNLQYQASTNTWRFAEKQYYTIGENNTNISSTYIGWIDLFGWGTSGYNNKYSYMTSTNDSDYGDGNNNISETRYDWGVYNRISNGGNEAGLWRTLTRSEWVFLLTTRYTSSGIRFAKAQVNGVNGVILVPDDWNVTTFSLNNTNEGGASYTSNVVGEMVWQNTFEPAGAVFLPAAGLRDETSVYNVGSRGFYWSASYYSSDRAYYAYFDDSDLAHDGHNYRRRGLSVRLVRSAQ